MDVPVRSFPSHKSHVTLEDVCPFIFHLAFHPSELILKSFLREDEHSLVLVPGCSWCSGDCVVTDLTPGILHAKLEYGFN